MQCSSCGNNTRKRFTAEIAIHSPGLEGIERPVVWVFPELTVCLDCGDAKFTVPEGGRRSLANHDATVALDVEEWKTRAKAD